MRKGLRVALALAAFAVGALVGPHAAACDGPSGGPDDRVYAHERETGYVYAEWSVNLRGDRLPLETFARVGAASADGTYGEVSSSSYGTQQLVFVLSGRSGQIGSGAAAGYEDDRGPSVRRC